MDDAREAGMLSVMEFSGVFFYIRADIMNWSLITRIYCLGSRAKKRNPSRTYVKIHNLVVINVGIPIDCCFLVIPNLRIHHLE